MQNIHKICQRKSINITKRIMHWYYVLVTPLVQIYQMIQIVTLQSISLTATVAYSVPADIKFWHLRSLWTSGTSPYNSTRIIEYSNPVVLCRCFSCTETNHNTFKINLQYTGINLYGLTWPVIGCVHSKHINEKETHIQYVLILTCNISGSGTLTRSAWDRNW